MSARLFRSVRVGYRVGGGQSIAVGRFRATSRESTWTYRAVIVASEPPSEVWELYLGRVVVTKSLFVRRSADTEADRRWSRRSTRVVGGALAAGALVSAIGFTAERHAVAPAANILSLPAATPVEAQQPQSVDAKLVADQRAQFAAQVEAQRAAEAEARRPKSVLPVPGVLSSTFGTRWGAMHAGIDFADPLGTPIGSVTDGTVVEAGPASGFGLWIRVQQDDGTIGVYGHVNDMFVTAGQHVRAGDIIGTVGNRGESTGPHLHYEVWMPGNVKVDPLPWLGARGLRVPGIDLSS